jgi:hypothetical protein
MFYFPAPRDDVGEHRPEIYVRRIPDFAAPDLAVADVTKAASRSTPAGSIKWEEALRDACERGSSEADARGALNFARSLLADEAKGRSTRR